MQLSVETVETPDAGRQPARFVLGGRALAVAVTDRWPGEAYTYFKVDAEDGNTSILRHDESENTWDLALFRDAEMDTGLLEKRVKPSGPH